MIVHGEHLLSFLAVCDKRFTIPIYQRNYDWKKEHCETLFNDIIKIIKHKKDYFIGSIVIIYDMQNEYLIIDGQQRITSISLLLLAMVNFIKNDDNVGAYSTLGVQLMETYLLNRFADENRKIKLKPVNRDNEAFLKLFNNIENEFISSSNVTINYNYFYSKLSIEVLKGHDIKQLLEAMNRLCIVKVELNSQIDNPQEIFESLNSTGKLLEESDLVRNFILMRQSPNEQQRFYETYWSKIEKNTLNQTTDFIRHYLTYKSCNVPNKNKVYKAFKDYVFERFNDLKLLEDLLIDLLMFSEFYKIIVSGESDDLELNRTLKYINKLKITVSYPFLFDLFYCEKFNIISKIELIDALKIVETYSLRRAICDIPSNALNKIYATLPKDIRKHENFENNYIDLFKYILLGGKNISSKRFPSNEEFVVRFKENDIYNSKLYIVYILEKLENYENSERGDIEVLLNNGKLTIEHVMPQTLSREWKKELGDNFAEILQKYQHTIGNLTLTGYNFKYSNKPFLEKRDMKNGFSESRLLLNKSIANNDKWGEEEIKSRATELSKKALNIWSYIETTYKSETRLSEYIYMSEDYDFTGYKPEKFVFLTDEYITRNWIDLYKRVIDILYDLDPSVLFSLSIDPTVSNVSDVKNVIRRLYSKGNNLYFEINLNTMAIISMIKFIFEKYNIDCNELGVLLKK